MTLRISKTLDLPASVATGKVGIVGRTGSGKTNTAVVMAERMIETGVPVAIVDPQGDWWGLRSRYSIAILGGEHADVPLEPTGGAIAADFVVRERVPVLLDLFKMGEGEMVRFARDFARRLWHTNREPLHIFLDEADLFAPQKGSSDKLECLSAWQNVCRRGRSRGIGLTMLTQRTAVINKDLLTQADPLLIHRMTAPQDLAAIDAYLEFHGQSKTQRSGILEQIASLPRGEAYVLSPGEMGIAPTRIKVLHRQSFDSSATPEAGQTRTAPKSMADVDLSALQKSMAATIETAKANDPKFLKAEIATLRQQLAAAGKTAPPADESAIARRVSNAEAARDKHWKRQFDLQALEIKQLRDRLGRIQKLTELPEAAAAELPATPAPVPVRPVTPAPKPPTPRATPADSGDLGVAHRRVLRSLFWLKDEERTPAKVAFFATYTVNGHFNNLMGNLRSRGLVAGWALTAEGLATIPADVEPKPTGAELREWMRPKLSAAENKILDVLIEAGGERLSAQDLAVRAGYTVNGHFNNCLGHMRTIDVAEGYAKDGGIKAADCFFGGAHGQ